MSKLGRNPIEDVLIGAAVASETTSDTFVSSASDKELKVLSADGTAPAAGEDFKVFQKTATGYEYSGVVIPSKVEKVILKEFSAEVQKSVTVEGFDGNVLANTTYVVEIRLYDEFSPENFTVISGYYVTGQSVTGVTAANIRDGIVASLNTNLTLRGGDEFTITTPNTSETDIVITAKAQKVVAGKFSGRQLDFQVAAKVYDNVALIDENLGLLTVTVLQEPNSGAGTGRSVVNKEYFVKGFKYESARLVSFPANFDTPYYGDSSKDYNAIHIRYYDDVENPSIEKQSKVLTIYVERANLAGNANTNAVLADLRTVLGTANVPADLATS